MTKTRAAATVATVAATETKMSKLLAQWHRQSLRTNPNAVEYPNREEIFALMADFDSKQMLRLAGFLQSVGKIYHADFEMTQAEKDEESTRLNAIRTKAQEESTERNLGKTARAERDAREAAAKPIVGMAVFAPDVDASDNYVLFPAHITELPTEEAETFMVKFVDADEAVEVPFVVASTDRAHRFETHRVPTDAQCDVLDGWYAEAPAAVEPVKAVTKPAATKGPKAKPVASDDDMLNDADLLADDAPKASTRKAAAKAPSVAKAKAAKPAAKVAPAKVGGPKKRTA